MSKKKSRNGCIKWPIGTKLWYKNDELHRLDGPAIEWFNGDKSWYQNGKRHRLDGPAFEGANGYKAWYQDGIRVSEKNAQVIAKQKYRITTSSRFAHLDFS